MSLGCVRRLTKRQNFSQFSGASPFPVVEMTNTATSTWVVGGPTCVRTFARACVREGACVYVCVPIV
jgi:hypothetical protein